MTLAACLARAVDGGRITAGIAGKINGRVQELLGKGLPEGEAMARAARELAAEAAEKERQ